MYPFCFLFQAWGWWLWLPSTLPWGYHACTRQRSTGRHRPDAMLWVCSSTKERGSNTAASRALPESILELEQGAQLPALRNVKKGTGPVRTMKRDICTVTNSSSQIKERIKLGKEVTWAQDIVYVCKNRDASGIRSEEIVVGKGVSDVSHGKRR